MKEEYWAGGEQFFLYANMNMCGWSVFEYFACGILCNDQSGNSIGNSCTGKAVHVYHKVPTAGLENGRARTHKQTSACDEMISLCMLDS